MKQLTPLAYKSLSTFVMLLVIQTLSWAQDSGGNASTSVTKSTTTTSSTWYAEPWVWVVGAAVLILLLVALFRGNSSSAGRTDKEVVTKTTSTDTNL